MTKNVVIISVSDNLWEVERHFRMYHLRHAPVCEDGAVVGMISLIDLRRKLPFEASEDAPDSEILDLNASDIMTEDPVMLQIDQTIKDAALLFSENEFHAVPVLNGDNLVGIISTTDIIRFLIESIDEIEESSTE